MYGPLNVKIVSEVDKHQNSAKITNLLAVNTGIYQSSCWPHVLPIYLCKNISFFR